MDRVCGEALVQWQKPGSDKVSKAFEKIDEVKGVMQRNLEKMVDN